MTDNNNALQIEKIVKERGSIGQGLGRNGVTSYRDKMGVYNMRSVSDIIY